MLLFFLTSYIKSKVLYMNLSEELSEPFKIGDIIEYSPGSVVSKTIIKKPSGTITLFSFDKGEGLSEHKAPFDALVQIIEGEAEIILDGKINKVNAGRAIILPADIPHALKANEKFKMLLTMIRS
jgi:quercetin dioxygenase-like cupin family protein